MNLKYQLVRVIVSETALALNKHDAIKEKWKDEHTSKDLDKIADEVKSKVEEIYGDIDWSTIDE